MEKVIYCSDKNGTDSDSLTVKTVGIDRLLIQIDNPWYGSTEGGFGAELEITLDKGEVRTLVESLQIFLGSE